MEKSLAEAQAKYADLLTEEKGLRAQLAIANDQVTQNGEALKTTRASEEEKNKQLADLGNRLQGAVHRSEEAELVTENLRNKLQAAEQTVKIQSASTLEAHGFNDADTKALFGARDLHIVDVYDVDTDGKTRRTYGRVYYVEKKLLTFYAFDLQDKKHNRAAAGFQAWGYREANQAKPESLGLFSLDDASINRWVLNVNNPHVLERIDAVYVTLELPNGSPSSGVAAGLLYANLEVPTQPSLTPPPHFWQSNSFLELFMLPLRRFFVFLQIPLNRDFHWGSYEIRTGLLFCRFAVCDLAVFWRSLLCTNNGRDCHRGNHGPV